MRILIDTNIILDVLIKRKNFFSASEKIFKICETKQAEGYISALSIPNPIYIMRKELSKEKTAEITKMLCSIFNVVDLSERDIKNALKAEFSDYEDALQSVQAKRINANYIITRNIEDYKNSVIKAILPENFLKQYNIPNI